MQKTFPFPSMRHVSMSNVQTVSVIQQQIVPDFPGSTNSTSSLDDMQSSEAMCIWVYACHLCKLNLLVLSDKPSPATKTMLG